MSCQPHIEKEEEDRKQENQPHTPAHAGPLGHAQHPGHIPSQPHPRAVERVVEVCEVGRVAYLVADGYGDLSSINHWIGCSLTERAYIFQHLHLGADSLHFGVVLGLEGREDGVRVMAPVSIV